MRMWCGSIWPRARVTSIPPRSGIRNGPGVGCGVSDLAMSLQVKPKEQCRWDLMRLGEVMLRFDPGDRRVWTTRNFDVSEGGGEYNVARGLKRCFGLDTAIVTAFADNPVGRPGR